jgi:hypothetical protein
MLRTNANAEPGVTSMGTDANPRFFLKTILALAILSRLLIVWFVLSQYPHGWFFRSQGELATD